MAKANHVERGPAAMGDVTPKTCDEYLARVPEPARSTLNEIRELIRSVVPAGTTEAISYGMPSFRYNGPLVWFAAFSRHCSLFVGAAVVAAFENELKDFQTSKGTIRFPVDKAPPPGLMKKLVKARIAQNERKKAR